MPKSSICLPARFESLSRALSFVGTATEAAGFSRDHVRRVQLVVEELFTNSIEHGYLSVMPSASLREPLIWLAIRQTDSGLEVDYQDAAPQFDPTHVPDGVATQRALNHEVGGLGRVLLNALPTSVHYSWEKTRNRIILRFDR